MPFNTAIKSVREGGNQAKGDKTPDHNPFPKREFQHLLSLSIQWGRFLVHLFHRRGVAPSEEARNGVRA
ncbi:hypothetical protein GCM10022404_23030 [Celeribacter arenosi]|uniref:Uncharacterized protein n=1 Tax=Celeribacter arenosi TaxID=792649 RepID=A0ABP7KDS6_9RHOB